MFSLQPCFLAVLLILSQVSPAISISIVADEVPESSAVSLLQAEAQIRKNAAAAVAAAAATKSAVLNSPPTSPAKGSLSDFNTEACDLATLGPASAKHFEDFSDVPPLRAASDTRFADAASSSPTQASVVSSSSSDDEDDDDDVARIRSFVRSFVRDASARCRRCRSKLRARPKGCSLVPPKTLYKSKTSMTMIL
mmetsp:Transcript_52465/g.111806  ORF Transcript_52465/g.111806 Transcript_52465/m.111806 type:complete len:195 (+) Transcript_52465:95-679(+)